MTLRKSLSSLLTRSSVSDRVPASAASPAAPAQKQGNSHGNGVAAVTERISEKSFHQRFPDAKYHPNPDCKQDHLLHHDLDLQLNHLKCWPPERQILLEKVYKKVNYVKASGNPGYWSNLREWRDYDQTATLIALSVYDRREAFCNCGFYGFSCHDRLVCPRCCHNLLAEPALREFKRAFRSDHECFYTVLSLSREADETKRLIFRDLTKSEIEQITASGCGEQDSLANYGIKFTGPATDVECQAYWRIFNDVIHEFTGRGKLFSGVFGGPELAVRFLPLAVLPHSNFIAWSSGLCGDDVRRLRRALRNKLRGSRQIKPGLYPKVAVYRILENPDLRSVIKYIFKPIDVGFAYSVAADAIGNSIEALGRLNSQADLFFQELPVIFASVHRISRFGFCSASSGDYVGVVTAERQDRREKDAKRRRRRQARAAKIRKQFPAYQPHTRKMSEKQRDDLRFMRSWYQQLVRDGELPGKPPKRWLKKMKT